MFMTYDFLYNDLIRDRNIRGLNWMDNGHALYCFVLLFQ